ncbi:hypothetical protein BCR35DRAFT_350657 [Leucosporidium creatinivorum]|uniref:Uncharacterized protein n=1 Tax=Leucosporidium creatinivorum TaxID=106004 RepID=A0A1Y2G137_9BASI|nr:hypothetical protein BCR35DRAFT_350657 [Leucosporidium creatinivorum]
MAEGEPRPTFPPSQKRYSSSADLYTMTDSSSPLQPRDDQTLPTTPDEEEGPSSWRQSYNDFKPHRGSARYSQGASTLVSSPSYNKLDLVEQPMLAKEDWTPGEPTKMYHAKADARRQSAIELKDKVASHSASFLSRRWKVLSIASLVTAVVLVIVLYFVIPRFPSVAFASGDPLIETDDNPFVSSTYGNYSFLSDLHVEINADDSYVPVQYSSFHVELRMFETDEIVAQGPRTGLKVEGRKKTVYAIPLTWSGSFGNATDPTFSAIYSACQHKYDTVTRQTLNLTMTVEGSVVGRIGSHTTERATVRGVECPVQFSASAN